MKSVHLFFFFFSLNYGFINLYSVVSIGLDFGFRLFNSSI